VIVAVAGVGTLSTMGALIPSRTGNLVGWVLPAIVVSVALSFLGVVYGEVAVPRGLALGGFALTWLASVPLFLALALFPSVFLLFPTGHLPSRRWRPVGLVYGSALLVLVVGFSLPPLRGHAAGVTATNPLAIEAIEGPLEPLLGVTGLVLLLCAFASLVALIVRYRGAGTEVRQQIRWLTYVGALPALALVGTMVTGAIVESDPGRWERSPLYVVNQALLATTVGALALGIPVACVVAILRYRLFELDRVVRRTVIVAILAAAITAVYVAIVSLPGALVEGDTARLLAAAAVAIAFQPVRDRARRIADRLVYGERRRPPTRSRTSGTSPAGSTRRCSRTRA